MRHAYHGTARAVHAAPNDDDPVDHERERGEGGSIVVVVVVDHGILHAAPRRSVRGRHDPESTGIRETRSIGRLADIRFVLDMRRGDRRDDDGGGDVVDGGDCDGI